MKKYLILLLWILFITFTVGCQADNTDSSSQKENTSSQNSENKTDKPPKSIIQTTVHKDITLEIIPDKSDASNITVQITNNGDSDIMTGDWFAIEIYQDGDWCRLKELEFESIGYPIEPKQTKELVCNYKDICELEAFTQYRILKSFTDENNVKYYIAKEFELNFQ